MLQISAMSSLISSFAIGSCKEACSLELLVLGRALAGLSAGLNTVLVPLVLYEASARSSVGALSQVWLLTLFILINLRLHTLSTLIY